MSRSRKGSPPSYRHHKARDLAVVTIDGKDHYLGKFGTPASRQKYAGLIRAWEKRQEGLTSRSDEPLRTDEPATMNELVLVYLKYAEKHYRPNHGENREAGCISDALAVLQRFTDENGEIVEYGSSPAAEFRPRDLKRVREAMCRLNWSRRYVNAQVGRIKRMFAHAVEEDLIPGSVYHALLVVKGLRKGSPGVREKPRVKPAPVASIRAVLEKAGPVIAAMIRFAYHTGARPEEVCALQPRSLDRSGKVWRYTVRDESNKTDHHERERVIYIGPRAQKVLTPCLEGIGADEFVFSPIRAELIRQHQRREARKTPLWPSHLRHQERKRKVQRKRPASNRYVPKSFLRAVKRLCNQAGVAPWTPNQLRHNAATRFRKKYGIEVARLLLGHSRLSTTEIYAEPNQRKAVAAIFEVG